MKNMKEQMEEYRRSRRFRNRWTKLLGAMACVVVFCTVYALILPAITLERKDAATSSSASLAGTYSVALHEDPSAVDTRQVDLEQDAHVELWAEGSADSWQWQIWSAESGSWFDIYGDDGQSCDLYYAKVKNMLRGSGAKLRAVATIDGVEWVSDTVAVSVRAFSAGAEETEDAEPVILSLGSEPLGDVSGMADGEKSTSSSVKTESIKEKETEATTEAPAETVKEAESGEKAETDELGSSAADESEKASEEEEVGTDETESGVSDESEDASEDGKLGTDEAESDVSDGSEDASEDEKAGADESSEIGEDSEKEENGVDESSETGKDGEKEENEVNESSGVDEDGEEEVKGADESSETDKDSEEEEDRETEDLADSFEEDAEENADETDEEDGDSESGVKSRSAAAASVRGSRKATGSNANRVVVIAEYDEDAGDGDPGEGTGESSGEDTPSVDVTKTYTVRVYYRYETGGMVQDPWWGTFAYTGETGGRLVEFPAVEGYKVKEVTVDVEGITPTLEEDASTGAAIGLYLEEEISSNVNYTVIYEPDTVSYTVTHFLQSLDDPNNYTVDSTETKYALAGTLLNDDAIEISGFTQVAYQYPTAAADSSTKVEIYYDRQYYKIDFELNGGEGAHGIYAQYGTDVSILLPAADPTRAGYIFAGWYEDEDFEQPINREAFIQTIPAENTTYYAKWTVGTAGYTVNVWVESLTAGQYDTLCYFELSADTDSTVGYDTAEVANYLDKIQNDKTFDGYKSELKYFTLDRDQSQTGRTVAGDGTGIVNVYYSRNSYTLRFVYARSSGSGNQRTYQMSTSNNGYSLHENYGPPYDIHTGCAWRDLNAAPVISSAYRTVIDNNANVTTGTDGLGSSTYTYYYIDVTAKYGENIRAYWPQAESVTGTYTEGNETKTYSLISWGTDYDSNFRTNAGTSEPNISPYYEVMDDKLVYDATKTADKGAAHTFASYVSGNQLYYWTFNFYYEALSAEKGNENTTTLDLKDGNDTKTYTFVSSTPMTVITTQRLHQAGNQAVPNQEGFVTPDAGAGTIATGGTYWDDAQDGNSNNNSSTNPFVLNIYYIRERNDLTFHNGYWGTKTILDVPYGEKLADYTGRAAVEYDNGDDVHIELEDEEFNLTHKLDQVEPLPANRIDENFEDKYEFSGKWYTVWSQSNKSGVGEEFDLTSATMPLNNLVLYPGWEPIQYTATFFWQNVQNPVLVKPGSDPDDPDRFETGVMTHEGNPITETYEYDGKLTYFDPEEYGQYEFLHWSYFRYTDDCEEETENGTIVHKEGTNLSYPEGLEYGSPAYTAYFRFVTDAMRDGKLAEVRLDFDTATFTSDVAVYGTWNEKVYVDYTVHYVLLDANIAENDKIDSVVIDHFEERSGEMVACDADGNRLGVQIADDTNASRYNGLAVTLTAKIGDELYEAYQGTDGNGLACYPVGSSTHSLTMDITQENLEYTFLYKRGNPVTYRVEYLTARIDPNTGEIVKDENGKDIYDLIEDYSYNENTTKAIVTVNFLDIPGYTLIAAPDSDQKEYQLTRVMTHADPITNEEDEIIGSEIIEANTFRFYYVLNDTGVNYTVEYYFQQVDGSYEVNNLYTQTYQASLGAHVAAEVKNYAGYWFNPEVEGTQLDGEVFERKKEVENGDGTTTEVVEHLVLRLYYDAYPVEITKVWGADVPEEEQSAVKMYVYLAEKQGENSYSAAKEISDFELSKENSWTYTVYLPYLEELKTDSDGGAADTIVSLEDQFYVIWEQNALGNGYLAEYTNGTEVFIPSYDGKSAVGRVDLGKTKDGVRPTTVNITVTNTPAVELPNTGGTGTMPYTIGGLIFMTGAAMCGLVQRRKRERRAKS